MNIKNWFKSPEGPMDLEAEVRKLRKKDRGDTLFSIILAIGLGFAFYMQARMALSISSFDAHMVMMFNSNERLRQVFFTQNKDIITDILLKNLEERGYELKMKDAQ